MAVKHHMVPGYGPKQTVRIMTVDPATRRVEATLKDGAMIQIRVFDVPAIFRWPKPEELWTVRRDSGLWVLDARIEHEQDGLGLIEDMEPGQTKITGDTQITGDFHIEGDLTVTGSGGGGVDASIFDAKGDMIAASAADTPSRVPAAPTDGYILKSDSTATGGVSFSRIAEASSVAACILKNSVAQSRSTGNALTFDTEVVDTDGMHSTVTDTDRIYCVTPGVYHANATVILPQAGNVGYREMAIYHKNAAGTVLNRYFTIEEVYSGATGYAELTVSANVKMAAGDFLQCLLFWTGMASPQNVPASDYGPHFSAVRIGDASGLTELTLPSARVSGGGQTISTSGAWTGLNYNAERWDTDNIWDSSADQNRLTCKTAGRYHAFLHVGWADGNGGNYRGARIIHAAGGVGGTHRIVASDMQRNPGAAGVNTEHSVTTEIDMAVGDYVYSEVAHDVGSPLTVRASSATNWNWMDFGMTRLGRATGSVGGEAWTVPGSFGGNWGQYGGAGDPYQTRYYKDPNGIVRLEGLPKPTSTPGQLWTVGIITLPVGYRPEKDLYFTGLGHDGTNYVTAHLHVNRDGRVSLLAPNNIASTGYVSLSGISFRAA